MDSDCPARRLDTQSDHLVRRVKMEYDKKIHFGIGTIAAFVWGAYSGDAIAGGIFGLIISIGIEIWQGAINNLIDAFPKLEGKPMFTRHVVDVADFVAGGIGAVVGALIAYGLRLL